MNPIIKFCKNWNNKLDNFCFTTIRNRNDRTFKYYSDNLDKVFDVFLKGQRYTQARLISVTLYEFHNIPQIILAIDTGKVNYTENFDIFKKFGMYDHYAPMMILLFEKV